MTFKPNAIELIDSYKISHVHMYPPKTDYVYSNFTARSNKHSNLYNKEQDFTVFVGIQATLKMLHDLWKETFFDRPKEEVVSEYQRRVDNIVGKGTDVSHMEDLHDLGFLPIEVRALEEGSLVPLKVPYFTVMNTYAGFGWLTNYLEDFFSNESWKMINNATLAHELRSILEIKFEKQGLDKSLIKFMCHDFSFRGMSGYNDGVKTSFAHLTSFAGSDTVAGVSFAEHYYGANSDKELVSASVPASEHSVMCAGLETGEIETFRRLFSIYPEGILSVVSDTWNFFRVITEYAEILKPEILARNGKLVYRPDSGNPADILCGTSRMCSSGQTPEEKGAVECLWEIFGGTVNEKGFKTIDPHVGLIYGDSITADVMVDIIERLEEKGFAANNVVFGIGSYSYNMSSRDTWGMAMKATWCEVDGKPRNIHKSPKTDNGMKKSATGLLCVFKDKNDNLYLEDSMTIDDWDGNEDCQFELVYFDGIFPKKQITLETIRKNLWEQF